MYYLQSRYYDPEICRFINADAFASTGQGVLGYNMFAYCNNNPTNCYDSAGTLPCQNTMRMSNDGGGRVRTSSASNNTSESGNTGIIMQAVQKLDNIFDAAAYYTNSIVTNSNDYFFFGYEEGLTMTTASGVQDSPIIVFADTGDSSIGIISCANYGGASYSIDPFGQEYCIAVGDSSLALRQGIDTISIRYQANVSYGMLSEGMYMEGYIRPTAIAAVVLAAVVLGPYVIPMAAAAIGCA